MTGLDKVEVSKQHLESLHKKFFEYEDHHKDLVRQMTEMEEKLQCIHSDMFQTNRADPKYLQLSISENKILQDQEKIKEELSLSDKELRDFYSQLATAFSEYHSNVSTSSRNYQYLSIVASAVISIVSITGSIIFYVTRKADLRKAVAEKLIPVETRINESSSALKNEIHSDTNSILNQLENQEKNIISALLKLEAARRVNNSHNNMSDYSNQPDNFVFLSMDHLKQTAYVSGIAVLTLFVINQLGKIWS